MEVSDRILLGNGWYRLWGFSFLVACLPSTLAFDSAPIPPSPFPAGRGRLRLSHARGFAPCIPGAEPGRHRLSLPSRYPVQGEPEVRRKNDRTAFLLAVPAAKERGDRGRWNYPSQATAAFEMVLSPGAGRTSAAGGLAFLVACRPCPEPSLSFIPISRREDRAQTIGLSQYSIFGKSSGGSGGLFQESPSVLPSVLPVVSPVPSAKAVRRERVRERPSRCMTV